MAAEKKFLVSQYGVDADGPRLIVWNEGGTKALFGGTVAACEKWIADAQAPKIRVKINSGFQRTEVEAILAANPDLAATCKLFATRVEIRSDKSLAFAFAIEQRWNEVRSTGGQTNAICSVRRQFNLVVAPAVSA